MTTPAQRQKLFKIINSFQDVAGAIEFNELLLQLEKEDPKEFHTLFGRLIYLVRHRKNDDEFDNI